MAKQFLTAQDVAEITGSSLSFAYTVIRRLNCELQADGYFIVRGKISRKYFEEKFYGVQAGDE